MNEIKMTRVISIFMRTDFKKMTDASLRGPKRPQEWLVRLMSINIQGSGTKFENRGPIPDFQQ